MGFTFHSGLHLAATVEKAVDEGIYTKKLYNLKLSYRHSSLNSSSNYWYYSSANSQSHRAIASFTTGMCIINTFNPFLLISQSICSVSVRSSKMYLRLKCCWLCMPANAHIRIDFCKASMTFSCTMFSDIESSDIESSDIGTC
jgi:hypothetical protein